MRLWIWKTKRFEVFKRDSFKCKYCWKNPEQDVVLEVDHIIPVAKWWWNEIENLITACFDCNRWKRDKMIDTKVVNKDMKNEVEQLKEQAETLRDYYKYLKLKNKLDTDKWSIYRFIDISWEDPHDWRYKDIESMIKKYWMEIAIEWWKIFLAKDIDDTKYFFWICKNIYQKQNIPNYDYIMDFYYNNIAKYDSYLKYNNKQLLIDIWWYGIDYFMNNYWRNIEDLDTSKRVLIKDQKEYLNYTDYKRWKMLINSLNENKEELRNKINEL